MQEGGWKLASAGLRLKLAALVLLSLLLVGIGVISVTDPKLLISRSFGLASMVTMISVVIVDFVGRSCCVATPVAPQTRIVVSVSMACQATSVGFLVTPFFVDQQLHPAAQLSIGIGPAVVLQIGAAALFMRYTREVAQAVEPPDLAVLPTQVLILFGLAGSSLSAVAIVLGTCLVFIVACGGCLTYTPFYVLFTSGPIVWLPVVILVVAILYLPFRKYGLLMFHLAAAIESWREQSKTPAKDAR